MVTRQLRTKLKIIFIIDLIVVAVAAASYFYLQAQGLLRIAPKPAEFTVTDLTINPLEADVGEPITISVNITNIGELEGTYALNLTINDVLQENRTIILLGGASTIEEFTVVQNTAGEYTVKINGLTGSFKIKVAPPEVSNISLSDLIIKPLEAWPGDPISIKATAKNKGDAPDSLKVKLMVDDQFVEAKTISLDPGQTSTVEFTFNTTTEGKHTVKLNTLTSGFTVVPYGMHTLIISSYPIFGIPFTLNGISHTTPYSELLPVGQPHTIEVPPTDPTGKYQFIGWEDGSTDLKRTITITDRTSILADFSGGISCPSLYIWNGTGYSYVAEISNGGWLGYIGYMNADGSIVFLGGNPWDHIKLDKTQLRLVNNSYYYMKLLQRWEEIFYLDTIYMLVVDHPSNVEVYPSGVYYMNPEFQGKIYTVSKNPLTPVSAFNERGENILPEISKLDGIFARGISGVLSPSWNNISWNRLTINLGDLSNAKEIKLIINGIVDWGPAKDYYNWINKFKAAAAEGILPDGTAVTPPPYLEVKDANGNWVRVDKQFPIPADYVPRTFVVDLTGIFLTNDYTIKINSFWNVTFDYIGIDVTPQENITIQRINPTATLYQEFNAVSASTGKFTRYGDVTELLHDWDDKFVIGRAGDAIRLFFSAENLKPAANGMERDFFLFAACWFKDPPDNWGYGFEFTVEPLPFRGMSGFPYPPTEKYPQDQDHLEYLEKYNTREITPLLRGQETTYQIPYMIAVGIAIVLIDVGILLRKNSPSTSVNSLKQRKTYLRKRNSETEQER
ncbi:MAG: CARDB domain-containing protein [Candidatus Bathyarchaeales archaeon]